MKEDKINKRVLTEAVGVLRHLQTLEKEARAAKDRGDAAMRATLLDRLIEERASVYGYVSGIERRALQKYVDRKVAASGRAQVNAMQELMMDYVRQADTVRLCSSVGIYFSVESPLCAVIGLIPRVFVLDPETTSDEDVLASHRLETGLVLGEIKVGPDPQQNNKIQVVWRETPTSDWQRTTHTTPDEAKAQLYGIQSTVDVGMEGHFFSDDVLTAVALGDLEIGQSVPLKEDETEFKWEVRFKGQTYVRTMRGLNGLCDNYCGALGLCYDHVSCTVTTQAGTAMIRRGVQLQDGREVCIACGQDIVDKAVQTDTAAAAVELARRYHYKANRAKWERVDAAIQLTRVALETWGHKSLSSDLLEQLVEHVKDTIGSDRELADRFVRGFHDTSTTSTMDKDNVDAVIREIRMDYSLKGSLEVCPVCGQPRAARRSVTREVAARAPLTEDRVEKGTTFKGAVDRETWGGTGGTLEKDQAYKKIGGVAELFRDGSQQAFNPFIDANGTWTKFSYRPQDAEAGYPWIGIVPASFESIITIDSILNNVPYVLVSEYFMRNNVSSTINLFQGMLQGETPPDSKTASTPDKVQEHAKALVDKVKDLFAEAKEPFHQAITLPFILYHRMKAKLYGNRYIFPYNPKDNPIATSSNTEEWGEEGGVLQSLTDGLREAVNKYSGMLGVGIAKPFPAPTWKLPESGTKWSLAFDLNLINDDYIRARNNYMCANTIINNNRWIQKTIFGFPGALYEIMVPTGVRELMCTGSFTLKPLGVNRHVPNDFFAKPFDIGSQVFPGEKNPMHSGEFEVIPDAYALNCTFTSAIPENLNNSVFGYYLDIATFPPGSTTNSALTALMSKNTKYTLADVARADLDPNADKELAKTSAAVMEAVAPGSTEQAALIDALIARGAGPAEIEFEKAKQDFESQYGKFDPNQEPKLDSWYFTSNGRAGDQARIDAWKGVKTKYDAAEAEKATKIRSEVVVEPMPVRDPFRWDNVVALYTQQYTSLRKTLETFKDEMTKVRQKLQTALAKRDNLPLGVVRKPYSKRIQQLKSRLEELVRSIETVENEMVELEMKSLLHGSDVVKARIAAPKLAVPTDYFTLPSLDPVTILKIRTMTSEERAKKLQEVENKIAEWDIWGIHKCKDFHIRYSVMRYIAALMAEILEEMKDVEETDPSYYEELRYRRSMLWQDLLAVVDTSKSFAFNRTNIVYIDKGLLPPGVIIDIPDEPEPEPDPDDSGDDLLPSEADDDKDHLPIQFIEEGVAIYDDEALIKQHQAEVIKQLYGDEEGLATAAFKATMEDSNPSGKYDRDVMIVLKRSPVLDDLTKLEGVDNMADWLLAKAGDISDPNQTAYRDVYRRLTNPGEDDEAIWTADGIPTRRELIRALAQDLYRRVSAHRFVLIQNAMSTVDTEASKLLAKMTNRLHRLEN